MTFNYKFYFKGIDIVLMLDYIDTDQAIQKNINNEDIIIIGKLLESKDPQTKFINDSHNLENKHFS